ncbi:discoidin domain-containing protein [Pedobacter gandavensis]|uniref:discoidin domain-containing protein n=1 Tax=Pedobacter gandavensis TaxID=2679963 RepID=UPI00292FE9FA|nr:discoidin domain-containing protein [Pedobacter gandavensis]
MKRIFLICITAVFLLNCKKGNTHEVDPVLPGVVAPPKPNTRISGTNMEVNKSEHNYNLNIVYFVPKDLDTLKGYQERLSELMVWGQDWYKEKMAVYGYDKTFGMFTDAARKKVRITTIYGTKNYAEYPSSGGNTVAWAEIDAYFKAHPEEKSSNHYLLIIPRYAFKPTGEPTGPPYYGSTFGTERTCFVLDYEDQELKNMSDKTDKGKWFRLYYGGLLHELGHALNLPHDMQTQTEFADPNKGTGLMFNGNYSMGVSPTFLTPFDCALLNECQVMNKNKNTYYGAVNASLTEINGSYDAAKGVIALSGKFNTNVPVSNIGILNDPNVNNEGVGTNKDYNALSFAVKPNGNSFSIEMPVMEFKYRSNEVYELKIYLIHTNGTFTVRSYSYKFVNNLPVIDFSTRVELPKTGWSVVDFSSEEVAAANRAADVIDGSVLTFWHSRWSSNAAVYPHHLSIDLGSSKTVSGGLSLTQREGANRAIKDFEILISSDNVSYTSLGNKEAANGSGTQYFAFDSPKTFRYFKIIAKSSWDGTQNAALAELGLY